MTHENQFFSVETADTANVEPGHTPSPLQTPP